MKPVFLARVVLYAALLLVANSGWALTIPKAAGKIPTAPANWHEFPMAPAKRAERGGVVDSKIASYAVVGVFPEQPETTRLWYHLQYSARGTILIWRDSIEARYDKHGNVESTWQSDREAWCLRGLAFCTRADQQALVTALQKFDEWVDIARANGRSEVAKAISRSSRYAFTFVVRQGKPLLRIDKNELGDFGMVEGDGFWFVVAGQPSKSCHIIPPEVQMLKVLLSRIPQIATVLKNESNEIFK